MPIISSVQQVWRILTGDRECFAALCIEPYTADESLGLDEGRVFQPKLNRGGGLTGERR